MEPPNDYGQELDQQAERKRLQRPEMPFVVGINGHPPFAAFMWEDDAAEFIGTLPRAEKAIYYLDGPEKS